MVDYITQNLWLFWTIVMIVCLILELSSGDFYVTCFAIGALISIGAAAMDAPFWLQVVVWAVCSILSILLIRPHLVKALHKGGEDRLSNIDALVGQVGEVSHTIVAGEYGRVKLDGDDWKADAPGVTRNIEVGEKVKVIAHESVIISVELI